VTTGNKRGYQYPRVRCPNCGVEATGYKDGIGCRQHRCPHGVRCHGRFPLVRDDEICQMPYRDLEGEWCICPVCLATTLVKAGLGIEGQPTWQEMAGLRTRENNT
jgi:hypothetical protein